jgi:hypothetical protein
MAMMTPVQSKLLLLGLAKEQLLVKPTAESFPPGYNPRCAPLWVQLFTGADVQATLARLSVAQAWDFVYHLFAKVCRSRGVSLFVGAGNTSSLDTLASALAHTRNVLVRFVDRSRLFDQIGLRVNSTETMAKITPTSLTIFTKARVSKITSEDLPEYLVQLPYPRLTMSADRIFYRDLDSHKIRFWVQYLNELRVFVGYKIEVPWTSGGAIPHSQDNSVQEVQDWVTSDLWPSLVVVRRIRGARFEMF